MYTMRHYQGVHPLLGLPFGAAKDCLYLPYNILKKVWFQGLLSAFQNMLILHFWYQLLGKRLNFKAITFQCSHHKILNSEPNVKRSKFFSGVPYIVYTGLWERWERGCSAELHTWVPIENDWWEIAVSSSIWDWGDYFISDENNHTSANTTQLREKSSLYPTWWNMADQKNPYNLETQHPTREK